MSGLGSLARELLGTSLEEHCDAVGVSVQDGDMQRRALVIITLVQVNIAAHSVTRVLLQFIRGGGTRV